MHVNEECENSHCSRDATKHGPQSDPELGKCPLVFVEVVAEAGHGTVGLVARGDAVEVSGGLVGDADERVAAVTATVPLSSTFVRRGPSRRMVRIPEQ